MSSTHELTLIEFHIHPAVAVGGTVNLGLVDNEEDL